MPGSLAAPLLVALRILWAYDGVPEGMKLYEVQKDPPLWQTEAVESLSKAPVGAEIPDATVRLKPGDSRKVALVYRNTTDKPIRFFAAPHHVEPLQASLGFKFKCLCTNHVYTVAPGQWWYRIVEVRLSKDFEGTALDIEHHLVKLPGSRKEGL